jgi:hypothetical protein
VMEVWVGPGGVGDLTRSCCPEWWWPVCLHVSWGNSEREKLSPTAPQIFGEIPR